MRQHASFLAAACAAALLAACAAPPPRAMLTYQTTPLGATLYDHGQSLGVAPVTRTYYSDGKDNGAIRTPEITAVWPSGAKATFWTNLKVGDDNVATIPRPAGAPGLDVDVAAAKKYEDANARLKADQQRDVKRASARCRAQQQGGVVAGVDDCN